MFEGGGTLTFNDHTTIDQTPSDTEPTILLVEDDRHLNQQLTSLLQDSHYQVTNLACGGDALKCLKHSSFDLIILDINLPEVDGFGLLNFIRSHSNTPVIMLTAYGAEEHRIRGLRYGADDYISKPCNFTEVSLRIEAILRRTGHAQTSASNRFMEYKELTLDKSELVVKVNETQSITLTPIQFKLLWTLVVNHGSVQSKPFLYQVVLERDFSPYDRSLDMHLSRVRKSLVALGMNTERIQTVHGKGYLLR